MTNVPERELRSFLMAREPSIDRRFRPRPAQQKKLFERTTDDDLYDDTKENSANSVYSSLYETNSTENSSNYNATTTTATTGVAVYLRLRPVQNNSSLYETDASAQNLIVDGCNKLKNSTKKQYNFSMVFDRFVAQKEIYEKCVYQKIADEENFSVLAYGTSGSGKTYTLLGTEENPGIIPRSINHIFTRYEENIYNQPAMKLINSKVKILDDSAINQELAYNKRLLSYCNDISQLYENVHATIATENSIDVYKKDDISVLIWISFAEIYNELVFDLLELPANNQCDAKRRHLQNKQLKVMSNDGRTFIKGLTSVWVKNTHEALQILKYGLQKVHYAATTINSNSSRSHCIFFVDILKYHASGEISEVNYKFIDLAGSERLNKTSNKGKRLKEAQSINTSLLVLSRCLDVVNNNRQKKTDRLIPVRDSKLTMLLQTALLGKEKLAMIVTVVPNIEYYEENLNVLGFSAIAKNIIYKQPIVCQERKRYSLFMNSTNTNGGQQHAAQADKLFREQITLRLERDRLSALIDKEYQEHSKKLREQENYLRETIVDSLDEAMKIQESNLEKRRCVELECQRHLFEYEIEKIKRMHNEEIEDLMAHYKKEKQEPYSQNYENVEENENRNENDEFVTEIITDILENVYKNENDEIEKDVIDLTL